MINTIQKKKKDNRVIKRNMHSWEHFMVGRLVTVTRLEFSLIVKYTVIDDIKNKQEKITVLSIYEKIKCV